MLKILNLYSGIGGNRKLWTNVEVTAVEYDESIAKIYKDLYPNDNIIVADAHDYLKKNFERFDFIWSSPPCQTHSKLNYSGRSRGSEYKYPDMSLYQQIILLQTFYKGKFCIENVNGYYEPLIKPQVSGRHYFWANFKIPFYDISSKVRNEKGFNLKKKMDDRGIVIKNWHNYKGDRRQLINNCVEPELGLHILDYAQNIVRKENIKQSELFFGQI